MAAKSVTTPGRAGRPRDDRCDRAIVAATAELLAAGGYDALSIEAVAARAGVAKTTVYRRWRTKAQLVADAFVIRAEIRLPRPDTGSLAGDLRSHLANIRDSFATPAGRAVLGLLTAGDQVAEVRDQLRSRWVPARRAAVAELVAAAVERGEVPPPADLDLAVDLAVAPLYYRLLVSGQVADDDFISGLSDAVAGLLGRVRADG